MTTPRDEITIGVSVDTTNADRILRRTDRLARSLGDSLRRTETRTGNALSGIAGGLLGGYAASRRFNPPGPSRYEILRLSLIHI